MQFSLTTIVNFPLEKDIYGRQRFRNITEKIGVLIKMLCFVQVFDSWLIGSNKVTMWNEKPFSLEDEKGKKANHHNLQMADVLLSFWREETLFPIVLVCTE